MKPLVAVVAYNRPDALRRLLASLSRAWHPEGTPLVISIDRGPAGADAGVVAQARSFAWPFGPKQVLVRDQHLGVVGHFRAVAGMTADHEAVVVLEDDLVVARPYYDFAGQALTRYGHDERIAGLSLYGLSFNGFTHDPFIPLDDGGDVFFLGLPYTQGIAFTRDQWQRFEAWRAAPSVDPSPHLHPSFLEFGPDEWFAELAAYVASEGRSFVFPRVSLTSGWGDQGAHFESASSWFQAPLQVGRREYRLPAVEDALAAYDSFYELLPHRLRALAPHMPDIPFDVDLNASKGPAGLQQEHVLTTRPVRKAILSFGLRMYPPELNVIDAIAGSEISLARRDDVDWGEWSQREARRRLESYFWARHRPSRRRAVEFRAARAIETMRGWARMRPRGPRP